MRGVDREDHRRRGADEDRKSRHQHRNRSGRMPPHERARDIDRARRMRLDWLAREKPLEVVGQRRRVRVAPRGVLVERALHDQREFVRHAPSIVGAERGDGVADRLEQRADRKLGVERGAARQRAEGEKPERVDIGARIDALGPSIDLLGRAPRRRPCEALRARGVDRADLLREAEVEHLRGVARAHEHVRRLDVAVHDTDRVRDGHRVRGVDERLRHSAHRVARIARGPRGVGPTVEGLPVDPFHDEQPRAIALGRGEERDDVRMRKRRKHSRLPREAGVFDRDRAGRGRCRRLRVGGIESLFRAHQPFDRNAAPGAGLDRLVDRALRAARDDAHEPVSRHLANDRRRFRPRGSIDPRIALEREQCGALEAVDRAQRIGVKRPLGGRVRGVRGVFKPADHPSSAIWRSTSAFILSRTRCFTLWTACGVVLQSAAIDSTGSPRIRRSNIATLSGAKVRRISAMAILKWWLIHSSSNARSFGSTPESRPASPPETTPSCRGRAPVAPVGRASLARTREISFRTTRKR